MGIGWPARTCATRPDRVGDRTDDGHEVVSGSRRRPSYGRRRGLRRSTARGSVERADVAHSWSAAKFGRLRWDIAEG